MAVAYDPTLTWTEETLSQKDRTWGVHGLHPYLGKFPPQVPATLIEKYSQPNDVVFDPFVGSGTTGVEALRLGRRFVGVDVAPFNVLLTRVKTGWYDLPSLKVEIDDFVSHVYRDDTKYDIPDYFAKWYSETAARQLMACRNAIYKSGHIWRFKGVLQVLVSRVARSARRAPHYELDFPKAPVTEPYWCYKHKRECLPTASAVAFLGRYAKDVYKRIREYDTVRGDRHAYIVEGDMRKYLTLPNRETASLVVTSPAYLAGIDYHEQHRYAYELFPEDLPRHDELEIGPAAKGRSKKAQTAYVEDMVTSLKNVVRFTKPGGILCIVANDSHSLYDGIRDQVGLDEVERVHRMVDRRTGLRSTTYSETIFVWKKPEE